MAGTVTFPHFYLGLSRPDVRIIDVNVRRAAPMGLSLCSDFILVIRTVQRQGL